MNMLDAEKLITHGKASGSEFQQESLQAAVCIMKVCEVNKYSGIVS